MKEERRAMASRGGMTFVMLFETFDLDTLIQYCFRASVTLSKLTLSSHLIDLMKRTMTVMKMIPQQGKRSFLPSSRSR